MMTIKWVRERWDIVLSDLFANADTHALDIMRGMFIACFSVLCNV